MPDNDGNASDESRTARAHAGEALENARQWPGYGMILVGLGLMAGALVAAGYGFGGWAWIVGVACVAAFGIGIALVLLEQKRKKNRQGLDLSDQQGH